MSGSPTSTRGPQANPPIYRVFRLGLNGAVEGCEIIQATGDDDAKIIAGRMVNGHGIDLWEQERFLESFPPLSASA